MNTTPIAPPMAFGQILIRSFVRASLIALYLTVAFAVWPTLAAQGEMAQPLANPAADGVLAALGISVLAVGTAVARWFRQESP